MSKFVEVNEKIAEGVVKGYKKIEDKFTETFLNEDGTMKTGKIGDAVTLLISPEKLINEQLAEELAEL